jgi:hypothetical protein
MDTFDTCEIFTWSRGVSAALADDLGHGQHAASASQVFTTACASVRNSRSKIDLEAAIRAPASSRESASRKAKPGRRNQAR